MIDIRELRIGNLVIGKDGKVMEVSSISLDIDDEYEPYVGLVHIGERNDEIIGYDHWINPIPLTREWLLRMGKVSENLSFEYEVAVGALKWYFRYNTEWYSEIGGIYIDSRVQYVHQLQNVFFSLVGHELNIEL